MNTIKIPIEIKRGIVTLNPISKKTSKVIVQLMPNDEILETNIETHETETRMPTWEIVREIRTLKTNTRGERIEVSGEITTFRNDSNGSVTMTITKDDARTTYFWSWTTIMTEYGSRVKMVRTSSKRDEIARTELESAEAIQLFINGLFY